MPYTNDATDQAKRQRDYWLQVIGLPLLICAALAAMAYALIHAGWMRKNELAALAIYGLLTALMAHSFLSKRWLKMPDGSYHYVADCKPHHPLNLQEPSSWLMEYRYTRASALLGLSFSPVLIGFAVFFLWQRPDSRALGAMLILFAIISFMSFSRKWLDKRPAMRIAHNGLWTRKLGFQHWDALNTAEVVVEQDRNNKAIYILEIRCKNTPFEQAGKPDERLAINALADEHTVQQELNNAILRWNESKHNP